jgi:XapX domain-containing protein
MQPPITAQNILRKETEMDWKAYAISLAVGLLVGGIYAVLNTRSPAPPVIALLGLLGMLLGEYIVSWTKQKVTLAQATQECLHAKEFAVVEPKAPAAAPEKSLT